MRSLALAATALAMLATGTMPATSAGPAAVDGAARGLRATPRVLSLRPQWVFDETADPEHGVFGAVAAACVDDSGRTWLLDADRSCVMRIGPTGRFEAQIGRPGEGPGDLRRPDAIAALDAERVAVALLRGARPVVVLHADGRDGGLRWRGEPSDGLHRGIAVHDGWVWTTELQSRSDGVTMRPVVRILRCRPDGTGLTEVLRMERPVARRSTGVMVSSGVPPWFVGPEGRLWVAPDDRAWLIERYDARGVWLDEIRRRVSPRRRSDAEMRNRRAAYRRANLGFVEPDREDPVIVAFGSPDARRVWVVRFRVEGEDSLAPLGPFDDLAADDGRWLGTVWIDVPGFAGGECLAVSKGYVVACMYRRDADAAFAMEPSIVRVGLDGDAVAGKGWKPSR